MRTTAFVIATATATATATAAFATLVSAQTAAEIAAKIPACVVRPSHLFAFQHVQNCPSPQETISNFPIPIQKQAHPNKLLSSPATSQESKQSAAPKQTTHATALTPPNSHLSSLPVCRRTRVARV